MAGMMQALTIRIMGDVDKSLTRAIARTDTALGNLGHTMGRIGTVGLEAMGVLSIGTIKALDSCVDAAENFEKSMADVVKYVDGLADSAGKISDKLWIEGDNANGKAFAQNYEDMRQAIMQLSEQIPYTVEDLTRLAAAAGQSGKDITELIQYDSDGMIGGFLKDVAMVGTAMDISADQAGEWAAKWEVAFNTDHDAIMDVFDQINYLGANSATTAAEIAQVVGRVGALGETAGMDVASVTALADTMLAMQVEGSRAATTIRNIMLNMSKGSTATKKQQEAFKSLGFTAEGIAEAMKKVDENGKSMAADTLISVFEAIKSLPESQQLATLNTLFGMRAVEGSAKLLANTEQFIWALKQVNDADTWGGSMEREYIIKASTTSAVDTMMKSAWGNFQIEVGDAFLSAKKQMGAAVIDLLHTIRTMPELEQVANTLAGMFSSGITRAADALEKAMPSIQQALTYLADNGPKVLSFLGKLAAVFAGMKLAPLATGALGMLGSAGTAVFGNRLPNGHRTGGILQGIGQGIGKLFAGGQSAGGIASNIAGEILRNGPVTSALAGINTARHMAGNAIAGSSAGRYLGGVGSALGGLGGNIMSSLKLSGNMLAHSPLGAWLGQKTMGLRTGLAGLGATANIYGSIIGQNISGALGGIANVGGNIKNWAMLKYLGFANSGAGMALGNLAGSAGGILSSGAGVLGSIWGPLASGFGALFAGAAPIVGVISAIIAVMSILWDNVDALRGPIEAVFGERGLAVFDSFKNGVDGVISFIGNLFNGGLADALAPLRDGFGGLLEGGGLLATIFGGKESGLAAFDGLVNVLQSVLGVLGQVVTFATTYVKPIIQDIFGFITGTVMPVIVQTFTAAAPFISTIIKNLGTAFMTVMTYIAQAIQAVMPFIQGIITAIVNVGSVVIPALLAGIAAFTKQLAPIIEGIKTIFQGIIDFIGGIFTGDWERVWTGIKDIFGGIFDTLAGLFKAPINAVIALINKAISGINGLGLDIPDWVPFIGGKKFSINIPELPMLAKGGFTNGPSIAGEAGREAVISFDSGARAQNIATWMEAGRLLGMNALEPLSRGNLVELKDLNDNGDGDNDWGSGGNFTFSPQITIMGNADKEVINEALEEAKAQFEVWYEQMMRRKRRMSY